MYMSCRLLDAMEDKEVEAVELVPAHSIFQTVGSRMLRQLANCSCMTNLHFQRRNHGYLLYHTM
jgi:hypothetical protein